MNFLRRFALVFIASVIGLAAVAQIAEADEQFIQLEQEQ